MNKWKLFTVIGAVMVLGLLTWIALMPSAPSTPIANPSGGVASTTENNSTTGTSGSVSQSSTDRLPSKGTGGGTSNPSTNSGSGAGGTGSSASEGSITITSPLGGDQWVFAQPHTISWSRAAGATNGAIYIVNASNGTVAGWILGTVGQNQSSFTWNTRDLYATRTGAIKKDISLGEYIVKVAFDAPGEPTAASAPFFIVSASSTAAPTYSLSVRNAAITPASLTIHRGDQLVFVNQDNATYQMAISNGTVFAIANLSSYTVNTSGFAPGQYTFYSPQFADIRTTITIQ